MLGEWVLVPGNDVTSRRSLGILNVFVAPGQGDATREYLVSGSSLSQAIVGTIMSNLLGSSFS